jgi:hypothetical protein
MPTVAKIQWSRNKLGDKIYVADTTGAYDPESNIEGWGAPNLSRSDYAIIPYVRYMASTSSLKGLELEATPANDISDSVEAEFTIVKEGDGWFKIALLYLPKTEAEIGKVYFDVADGLIKKVTSGAPIVVTKEDVLNLPSASRPMIVDVEDFFQPKLSIWCDELNERKFQALKVGDVKKFNQYRDQFDLIKGQMISADYRFWSGLQAQAQEIVEDLMKNVDE